MRVGLGELTLARVSFLRRLLEEPLVHFLAIGATIFGVAALRDSGGGERDIVVTRAVRERLLRELTAQRGQPPREEELSNAVRRWSREEALYREGLRLGLDRDDAEIRKRVIARLLEVQKRLFIPPEPRPEELDAWLERNRHQYELPPRYDFEHVFASKARPDAKSRAASFSSALQAGSATLGPGSPGLELGDRFPDGAAFVAQTPERIRRLFGASFASELPNIPVGRWALLESEHGWHVVRLRLAEGGLPPRELLGARLVHDFRAAALEKDLARYTAGIQEAYRYREDR